MAYHLVSGHLAPTPWAGGLQPFHPLDQLLLVARVDKTLHRSLTLNTIKGRSPVCKLHHAVFAREILQPARPIDV